MHAQSDKGESRARQTGRRVLEVESSAVREMSTRLDASFDHAVEQIVGCKGRVVVTGMGKWGIICQKVSATLSSTEIGRASCRERV